MYAQQKIPACLQKQGTATQLIVDNAPFLVLGGELGNSSATSGKDIEAIFPKLNRMGLNTVLVPAYWNLIEPTEGDFDFTLIDKVVMQARKEGLKVIFLWFGAWKNSMSCYAPLWFKENYKKYPRARTSSGKPMEIASSFSENVFQADNRAFTQWLNHIKAIDEEHGTVIMIQIQNEIGMLEDARDHSEIADKLFRADVPSRLMEYLKNNRKSLHPYMLKKWGENGYMTTGNWQQVFGADLYTDEIFQAWHYAGYVEKMSQTARAIHDIPLFVNAALNSRGRKPGEYPSAGPLAHLIDIWRCAAPSIDFLAPDLYDDGFIAWTAQYKLHNNPLFIPEIRLAENNAVRAFYVFGEHDAIGFSPFSIEDGSDNPSSPLVRAYACLREITPLITRYQGLGLMNGLLFDQENRERILERGNLRIHARHFFTLPWDLRATDGSTWPEVGGLIVELGELEYLVVGCGIVLEFEKGERSRVTYEQLGEDGFAATSGANAKEDAWDGALRIGIGKVDEVEITENGDFRYVRSLNGDQTHQGRHVRISVDDFSILHVKLYEYK